MKLTFTWSRPTFLSYPTQLCLAAIPVQICGFIGRAYDYELAAAKVSLLGYSLTAAGVIWGLVDLSLYVRRTRREMAQIEKEFQANMAKFEASKAAMFKELERFEKSAAPLDPVKKPGHPEA